MLVLALLVHKQTEAHPTGNLIMAGDKVLWSYVYPIEDKGHYACVMMWDKNSQNKPKPLIVSEFNASDFMLYANDTILYIIERRFIQSADKYKFRILKSNQGTQPTEIWPWQNDKMRIGEGGFRMNSDNEIVFCRYPNIYIKKKEGQTKPYFEFAEPIKKIRAIGKNKFLLISDNQVWLTDSSGDILQNWNNLTENVEGEIALNRNMIFDADWQKGKLLIAYWGKRSFEIIGENGKRKVIKQYSKPWVPHWVAFDNSQKFLFSSKMEFNGNNPEPELLLFKNEPIEIWTKQ
ncbi:MAG: hypothetical protein DWQ03_15075 [Calditrichaeota bacterium]|nr:MAG: hypothetical protein DWQ03_15075 [Calditrichota bacterium]